MLCNFSLKYTVLIGQLAEIAVNSKAVCLTSGLAVHNQLFPGKLMTVGPDVSSLVSKKKGLRDFFEYAEKRSDFFWVDKF